MIPLTAPAEASGSIQVGAASGWVDTGISVMAGDQLSITATGSWTADGTSYTGPDGYIQTSADNFTNLADIGVCASCATTQAPKWGALVGYVGSNPPEPGSYTSSSVLPRAQRVFVVGSNMQATTPMTGELWLAMNDDAYSGYTQDNAGSVSASILDSNNPPPGESITQNILLYIEDPTLANMGNEPLNVAYGWPDPSSLADQVASDLEQASHGIVHYNIVQTVVSNQFPVYTDGFQYTDSTWESDWAQQTSYHNCNNGEFDYNQFITGNNIVSQINSGAIDEVWMYGDPMACMSESTMAGDGAYWLNSNPVQNVNSPKAFVIMGWNYQVDAGYALHSYGHRTEDIMCHMYGIQPGSPGCLAGGTANNWDKFVTLDKNSPGLGGIGYVHCPVNGCQTQQYDYANPTYVTSNADDWFNYPNFTGETRQVSYTDWAPSGADFNTAQLDYMEWWYDHMPHFAGRGPDGLLNDWWHYIVNVDQYKYGDLPPDTTITSGPSGTVNSTSATFTFSSSEPESTYTCSLDGSAFVACPTPYTITGLGQGTHTLLVAAVDHAGNVDPSPASATWAVNTADTVSVTNPGNKTTYTSAQLSLQVKGSSSGGYPLTWSATGLPSGLSINSSTGHITGQLTGTGTYNVTITAQDQTGATGKTSFTWVVKPDVGTAIGGDGGLCLDDWQSTITSGNLIDTWVCNSTGAQKWTLSSSKLEVLGQCLTDPGNRGAGTGLVIQPCKGTMNQLWTHKSNGEYAARVNGLCMTETSTSPGHQVDLTTCTGSPTQKWSGS